MNSDIKVWFPGVDILCFLVPLLLGLVVEDLIFSSLNLSLELMNRYKKKRSMAGGSSWWREKEDQDWNYDPCEHKKGITAADGRGRLP